MILLNILNKTPTEAMELIDNEIDYFNALHKIRPIISMSEKTDIYIFGNSDNVDLSSETNIVFGTSGVAWHYKGYEIVVDNDIHNNYVLLR